MSPGRGPFLSESLARRIEKLLWLVGRSVCPSAEMSHQGPSKTTGSAIQTQTKNQKLEKRTTTPPQSVSNSICSLHLRPRARLRPAAQCPNGHRGENRSFPPISLVKRETGPRRADPDRVRHVAEFETRTTSLLSPSMIVFAPSNYG
jgi:hypothetical protein